MADLLTVLQKPCAVSFMWAHLAIYIFTPLYQHSSLLSCFIASSLGICVYVGEMVLCSQKLTMLAKCKQSDLCCVQEQGDVSSFIQSGKTTDSLLPLDWAGGNCCIYSFKIKRCLSYSLVVTFISVAFAHWALTGFALHNRTTYRFLGYYMEYFL